MLRVPVTPEERELIEQKMVLLHTRNFSAYARKMLIDGYIVNMDTTDIRVQTAEIQKIGANVNQIAKRLNSMGPVYAQDIEDIKGALAQISPNPNSELGGMRNQPRQNLVFFIGGAIYLVHIFENHQTTYN